MNKKVLFSLFVILGLFGIFLFTENTSTLPNDIMSLSSKIASSDDPGVELLTNSSSNPNFNFELNASVIDRFTIYRTLNAAYTVQSMNARVGTNEYRTLNNATDWGVYYANNAPNKNFNAKNTSGTSRVNVNNYLSFGTTITTTVPNEEFIVKLESHASGTAVLGSGIYIREGNSLTGRIINSIDFDMDKDTKITTLKFVPGVGEFLIEIRAYQTNSANNSAHYFKRLDILRFANYNIQDLIYKLHTTTERTVLSTNDLPTLQTKVNEISDYLTLKNSVIGSGVKTMVNDYLAKANLILTTDSSIKNAYTDLNKTEVKPTITQSVIDAIKTDANNVVYEPQKTELVLQANELELVYKKQVAKEVLDELATSHNTTISSFGFLSESLRTSFITNINDALNTAKTNVQESTTIENVEISKTNGTTALNDIYLNAYKENSKGMLDSRLNEVITQINGFDALTDVQKNTYINSLNSLVVEYKTNIENSNTIDNIDIERNKGLDDINNILLNASKEEANTKLDALVSTSTNDAPSEAVTLILNNAKASINEQTTIEEVETKYNEAVAAINLQLQKEAAIKEITEYATSTKAKIDALGSLTESEKATYKDLVDAILSAKTNEINEATQSSQIDALVVSAKAEMDQRFMEAKKADAIKELENKQAELNSKIDLNETLTEQEKQAKKDELAQIVNDKKTEINNETVLENIDGHVTDALDEMNQSNLATEKTTAKREIDEMHVSKALEVDALSNLTEAEKTALKEALQTLRDEAKTLVDEKTTVEEITTVKSELANSFDGASSSYEALNDERQALKEALESYAVSPIDQAEKDIIDAAIAKVTLENYTNEEAMGVILAEGKTALDEYYAVQVAAKKEEVREILETYAKEPITEGVQEKINEVLAKITKDNYEDTAFIETEVETGKANILAVRKAETTDYLNYIIGDNAKTGVVLDLYNEFSQRISDATTIDELNQIKSEIDLRLEPEVLVLEKPITEKAIEDRIPKPHSDEIAAIIEEAKEMIKDANSLEELRDIKQEYIDKLDEAREKEQTKTLNDFNTYYNEQKDSHTFTDKQTDELEILYSQLHEQLEKNEITLDRAKALLLAKIKAFTDVVFQIVNGPYDILDDKLEYPVNATDEVFAGIRNTSGIRRGTSLEITRTSITDEQANSLRDKFMNGTMTIPSDSTLTTRETKNLLEKMEYIRQLNIRLKNSDGTVLTEFDGTYLVSILIPTEYRNYDEFIVIFETSSGIEVFKTYRTNSWLTFETSHFSSFYILGSESKSNNTDYSLNNPLMIILILSAINLLLIFVVIVIKFFKKKNSNKVYSNTFLLATLALTLNDIIIILLSVAIVILIIYIIYLLLRKYRRQVVYTEVKEKNINLSDNMHTYIIREDEMKIEEEVKVGYLEQEENVTVKQEMFEEDEEQDDENEIDLDPASKIYYRYNYSLKARMHLATKEAQERYSNIKNLLMSYDGVKLRSSWRYDRFTLKNQTIVKMSIFTNTVKLYLSVNPKEIVDRDYNLEDIGNVKVHESTPYLYKVNGPKLEAYAEAVIKKMLDDVPQNEKYERKDYSVVNKTKAELIKLNLIKVSTNSKEIKYSDSKK